MPGLEEPRVLEAPPGAAPRPAPNSDGGRNIDPATARQMLVIDFEQAFAIHNHYRDSERDLYKLSLRIAAFPLLLVGALLSANLVSSVNQIGTVLQPPFVWLALLASGLLNTVVVRAYIVNDRVQTEAKHQVNRLRGLYLQALAGSFPQGWQPVWGSTNPYLESRRKFKAAFLAPVLLAVINAIYIGFAADRLVFHHLGLPASTAASVTTAVLYFLAQHEVTWNYLRDLRRRRASTNDRTGGDDAS